LGNKESPNSQIIMPLFDGTVDGLVVLVTKAMLDG
jgi:hypothetical protein